MGGLLATGWTVHGSNPGGGTSFSAPLQTGPGAHRASYKIGTRSFPEVKRPGFDVVTTHPYLAPRLKKE